MIKKALVVVPHEDDEINLVGTVIQQMTDAGIQVNVLFVTNGDYEPEKAERRMRETMRVVRQMKFSRTIFLGYGDSADGNQHIFNSQQEPLPSKSGHTCTYGLCGQKDFRYDVCGYHSDYRIECLQADMLDCILRERADLLFCVDLDSHPDHRMTSLVFDRAIHRILIDTDYRPMILKKFAYAGTWHGKSDYFSEPMLPTILEPHQYFPYAPEQGIRLRVDPRLYPAFFWKSSVYHWAKCYQTQGAADHFLSIVNADSLFFYRDTSNLAPLAQVFASSGRGSCVNDFMLFDTDTVCGNIRLEEKSIRNYTWIPEGADTEKKLELFFQEPVSVEMLALHQSHDPNSRIHRIKIQMDNGYTHEQELNDSLYNTVVLQDKQNNIRKIVISVIDYSGNLAGFREIEVFDHRSSFPWAEVPFSPYTSNSKPRKFSRRMQKLYHLYLFLTVDLKENGVMYFVRRLFSKK